VEDENRVTLVTVLPSIGEADSVRWPVVTVIDREGVDSMSMLGKLCGHFQKKLGALPDSLLNENCKQLGLGVEIGKMGGKRENTWGKKKGAVRDLPAL